MIVFLVNKKESYRIKLCISEKRRKARQIPVNFKEEFKEIICNIVSSVYCARASVDREN